ncbi:MAG TPA: 50S ribosomal protein L6, partial [Pirellulaceae bacterium]|nr:50S ribosomal protein L6 [Pirellulaceae bacterium]
MSRIGKKPVSIVDGVKIAVQDRLITVEGPLGKLQYEHRPEVKVSVDEASKEVSVTRESDEREVRAFHGLTRALINNMIVGVKDGYEK